MTEPIDISVRRVSRKSQDGQVASPDGGRRPDRRPGQTVRKVLDAGIFEVRTTSYARLTMRAVATRAGVSTASTYRYFPSKNVLVATLYRNLLLEAPMRVDVNDTTKTRIRATMRDILLVGADEPALTAACAIALVADDPATDAVRVDIANEVARRIRASLGPGWPEPVIATLVLTFSGAMLALRFLSYEEIVDRLDAAVDLILGASVA